MARSSGGVWWLVIVAAARSSNGTYTDPCARELYAVSDNPARGWKAPNFNVEVY